MVKGMPFLSSSFQRWINNNVCCPFPLQLDSNINTITHTRTPDQCRGRRGGQCLWQIGARSRAGGAVVLIGCLASSWWNLNNAGLVDDASAAVTFLYNPDDPCSARRPLTSSSGALTLHLRAKLGRLLSGQTHQQPAWKEEEKDRVQGSNTGVLMIYTFKQ